MLIIPYMCVHEIALWMASLGVLRREGEAFWLAMPTILICSIATLNSVYLHDRLGRESEVGRTKRRNENLGWASKD